MTTTNTRATQLAPGKRFYYNLPEWAKKQDDNIFAPLATVLSEIVINEEPTTEENILAILNNLDETNETKKNILSLIAKHNDDLGEVIWPTKKN